MKIKMIIILAVMCLLSVTIYADRGPVKPADVKAFLRSTTYVVLEDNPMSGYNSHIKDAVTKSWTITPAKFISQKEFETARKDPAKSFLFLIQLKFDKDKIPAVYNFLTVSMGNAAVVKAIDMPDVCSVPLSYYNVPEDDYIYKIESIIRFMQSHIKAIDKNPSLIKSDMFADYNNNTVKVKTKELWLVENDIEKNTRALAEIRKNYSYTVKIVTPEVIKKAIASKNENVVYLHKVGPSGTRLQARCYKFIIGAGDDQIYYYDYHTITKSEGDGMLNSDFKKMGRK